MLSESELYLNLENLYALYKRALEFKVSSYNFYLLDFLLFLYLRWFDGSDTRACLTFEWQPPQLLLALFTLRTQTASENTQSIFWSNFGSQLSHHLNFDKSYS